MTNLVTLKTISGDEIIGKLIETTNDEKELGIIKLSEPFTLIFTQQGLSLMPVLLASKIKEVPIFISALLTPPLEASAEFEQAYIKQTSGLVFN